MNQNIADNYVKIGSIQRAHGFHGKVLAWLAIDVEAAGLKNIFIQLGHTLVPYHVTHWECLHDKFILAFQGIEDRTQAYTLKGKFLFVRKVDLLESTFKANEQLICMGYRVVDEQQGTLGTIIGVENFPSQRMLVVKYLDKDLLIPMHAALVRAIDHLNKQINVCLPLGFIEAVS